MGRAEASTLGEEGSRELVWNPVWITIDIVYWGLTVIHSLQTPSLIIVTIILWKSYNYNYPNFTDQEANTKLSRISHIYEEAKGNITQAIWLQSSCLSESMVCKLHGDSRLGWGPGTFWKVLRWCGHAAKGQNLTLSTTSPICMRTGMPGDPVGMPVLVCDSRDWINFQKLMPVVMAHASRGSLGYSIWGWFWRGW